ncbi:MAG: hypothetical protein ABSD98_12895 [Candidatus Korobacteraceae bacterium]|jgi:hypothetical protein
MPATPDFVFGETRAVRHFRQAAGNCYRAALGVGCALLLLLGCAQALKAQVLSPPVQLGPTAAALEDLHKCGKEIARSAPNISADILDAQQQLFFGLVKGGYTNQSSGGRGYSGYNRNGGYNNGGYQHNGDWLLTPPPKEYVADLQHEAAWCLEVANILNTDPTRKEAAKQVLASIAKDLEIKMKDCKDWGAGRLVTVIASTIKNGQPDPGWTVMYKWVSVSGLNSMDLAFPQMSTPTSKGVPPGVYSLYATKQVGNTTMKTQPVTVSAFQNQKVKCEIPVP